MTVLSVINQEHVKEAKLHIGCSTFQRKSAKEQGCWIKIKPDWKKSPHSIAVKHHLRLHNCILIKFTKELAVYKLTNNNK